MKISRAAILAVSLYAAPLFAATSTEAAGALAVGACGAYGQSFDFSTMPQARARALEECRGTGCRVVVTMRRACAAFAIDIRNPCGPYGYATAPRLGRAQNAALRQCYRFKGKDCVIRAWACDAKG